MPASGAGCGSYARYPLRRRLRARQERADALADENAPSLDRGRGRDHRLHRAINAGHLRRRRSPNEMAQTGKCFVISKLMSSAAESRLILQVEVTVTGIGYSGSVGECGWLGAPVATHQRRSNAELAETPVSADGRAARTVAPDGDRRPRRRRPPKIARWLARVCRVRPPPAVRYQQVAANEPPRGHAARRPMPAPLGYDKATVTTGHFAPGASEVGRREAASPFHRLGFADAARDLPAGISTARRSGPPELPRINVTQYLSTISHQRS